MRVEVDFSQVLRLWDGFGFNYVETAHTYDYDNFEQEYGGFSLMSEADRQPVVDIVFGANGLQVAAMDSEIAVIGFASNGTANPDAAVVVNIDDEARRVRLAVKGTAAQAFRAYRTTEDEKDLYAEVGVFPVQEGGVVLSAPAGSVTTLFAE